MLIPDDVRKCVAFVGLKLADGTFRLAGSVFFLGRDKPGEPQADPVYAVTARHVIDGIRGTGVEDIWLRLNLKDGDAKWFQTRINDWFSHPIDQSIDVSILKTGLDTAFDHLVFPYSLCITDEKMNENEVGLGDEVFITGMFRHHHGTRRNIPIVRVGNIACMTEEKITTKSFGEMDAYLVEARSIGGLSGSPVFLNLGIARIINQQMKFASGSQIYYLFGLVHGHYDVEAGEIDSLETEDRSDSESHDRVNTGIAMVVPFRNIDSVIIAHEADELNGLGSVYPW